MGEDEQREDGDDAQRDDVGEREERREDGSAERRSRSVVVRVQVRQVTDLLNISRQTYDYLTTMPKLRSTYDGRLMYEQS